MPFGSRIRAARKSKGLRQEELANLIGVSTSSVTRWENDEREPTVSFVKLISERLEVPTWTSIDSLSNGLILMLYGFLYGRGENGVKITPTDGEIIPRRARMILFAIAQKMSLKTYCASANKGL